MELNIKTVYSYRRNDGKQAFIYSVKCPNLPEQYIYYILDTNEENIPFIKRVNQTINLLQKPSLVLTPLEHNSEEYNNFISSLASAVRIGFNDYHNNSPKKYRKIPHQFNKIPEQK